MALSLEDVRVPGAMVPFSVEPNLLELEGGRHVGPLLLDTLVELVSGRRDRIVGGSGCRVNGGGSSGGGEIGSSEGSSGVGGSGGINGGRGGGACWGGANVGTRGVGGAARVRFHYEAHLPTLSFWDRENLGTILAGTVFPTVFI